MSTTESMPVVFECLNERLVGIIEKAPRKSNKGLLLVVGGPQYRVGSHQFFTKLCRDVAASGYSTMRFDHRGIGDSEGATTFEDLNDDIAAAIDTFCEQCPELSAITIWGLCDAASAAIIYSTNDDRVDALIVANPWVRDDRLLAMSNVQLRYSKQLLSAEFWRRLLSGQVNVWNSARDAIQNVRKAYFQRVENGSRINKSHSAQRSDLPFQTRMSIALENFRGNVLVLLSENDITADEFRIFFRSACSKARRLSRPNIEVFEIADADHTFARQDWKNDVIQKTIEWLEAS